MNIMNILKNRIVKNAGWLIAGRIIHMILSFLIGLLTARYLGPSNYGLINYAAAYATFFTAFCTLGINSVIVKNFIDHPEEEGETLGTTIILRLVSSFLSLITIVGFVSLIDKDEPVTVCVVALYCIGLVFQVFDTFNYWFQSKLLSKYYAAATLIAYILVSLYKVVLLITGKSVQWFAVSNSIDYLIIAFILFAFYKKNNGPKLSFSIKKSKELLSLSVSYILSGLMVAIYAATDKLMLKQMMDESTVGYYSLAVSISTIWTFVLSAVIDSMKPRIMELHNTDREEYLQMNRRMYAIVFYVSVIASLGITIIAPLFIKIVYGEAYLPAVTPLRIVVWYVAFSYLGVARDAWMVCEKMQKYLKYIYFFSVILNIVLNAILIPFIGASGAAVASLLTQISTVLVFPLLFKELRANVKMIASSIILKNILPKKLK